jgi:hypothetical protein
MRCNVEQPTTPCTTVASLGSAYFNMVKRSRTLPSGGGNLPVRGKTGTILKHTLKVLAPIKRGVSVFQYGNAKRDALMSG